MSNLPDLAVRPESLDTRTQVESLLVRMTLAEKVGQMTQLALQTISRTKGTSTAPHALDPAQLRHLITNYHIGSFLNIWFIAYTPAYWHEIITAIQDVAINETRLGIPVIYGIDSVHGANYTLGATLFPHNIAIGATFNPDYARAAGAITARETRASGIPWNFAPDLDVGRHPLWSRFFETFSEDVYLTTLMGTAAVKGNQGDDVAGPDRVAACAKHFVGYSYPASGKDRTPSWMPEHLLREIFLPSFEAAIKAGVKTIMVNSGEINGIPVHADPYLLTDVLRDELGFDGVVVTDWEDIVRLHTQHRVADSHKEAVRLSVLAGIDMSMTPFDVRFCTDLIDLVEEGAISEERIDASVRRILTLKFELGLFENPYPDPDLISFIGRPDAHRLCQEIAEASITLTQNRNHCLPLRENAKVLVTGPAAASHPSLHGSWSYTWQGADPLAYPENTPHLADALQARGTDVTFVDASTDLDAALETARHVDVVILALGEVPTVEKPGDIEDLTLPAAQAALAKALHQTGTPIVLVMLQGRPRIIDELVRLADAVVLAYWPGMHGGTALARVLYGDVNPSGKLPFTYPRTTGSLVTYDHKTSEELDIHLGMEAYNPQWDFGHGLSYTTFEYANLQLQADHLSKDGTLEVSVTLTNTGNRSGTEVVQLYTRDEYASITPPVRRLRAFKRVALEPGQASTVMFNVPVQDLAFVNQNNRWVVEPGSFLVMIDGLSARFHVR